MKRYLVTGLRIAAVYLALMVVLELSGQLLIRWLEARKPSGITAENILSHQEPVLGFGLKKNLKEAMGHWEVSTDRWGFRGGNSFDAKNDTDEKRLFVVGGSTVFGWGVSEADSIPGELQKAIDEEQARLGIASPRVRVVNAGVPWYASWHEAALIYFRLLELSPDWIVVMDGLNDTANGVAPTWRPIYEGYVDTPTQLAFQRRKEAGSFSGAVMEMLKLSPTLRYFFARINAREQTKQGVYHEGVWEQYLSYMSKARDLTQTRGTRFSLFFQPVMLVDKPLDYFEVIHNGTSMVQAEFGEKFKRLYIEGEQRLLGAGLGVTSLREAFKDHKEPIYLDGLHYNAKGNKLLARLIFEKSIKPELANFLQAPKRLAAN